MLKICGFLNAHVYQSSSTLVTYVNPISLANKLSPNCLFKFSCNAFAVPTCHIAENLASITLIRVLWRNSLDQNFPILGKGVTKSDGERRTVGSSE